MPPMAATYYAEISIPGRDERIVAGPVDSIREVAQYALLEEEQEREYEEREEEEREEAEEEREQEEREEEQHEAEEEELEEEEQEMEYDRALQVKP